MGVFLKEYENEYYSLRHLVIGRKYVWIYDQYICYNFPLSKQFQQQFVNHWRNAGHWLGVGSSIRIKTGKFLAFPS